MLMIQEEFVNPLVASLLNVLKTMAGVELDSQPIEKNTNALILGDISSSMGMTSAELYGTFSITLDASLALHLMESMLGEKSDEINDEVTDMLGEITNMVAGGAKRAFEQEGINFEMENPVIVVGPSHRIEHKSRHSIIHAPFTSQWGNLSIQVSVK